MKGCFAFRSLLAFLDFGDYDDEKGVFINGWKDYRGDGGKKWGWGHFWILEYACEYVTC